MREAACAILIRGDIILLGRRNAAERSYPGCWDLVGGHAEAGESIEAALVREVREEAGVTPTAFRLIGRIAEPDPALNGAALYHIYLVTAWEGGEPVMTSEEHAELRWLTIEEACALPRLALAEYPRFFRSLAAPRR